MRSKGKTHLSISQSPQNTTNLDQRAQKIENAAQGRPKSINRQLDLNEKLISFKSMHQNHRCEPKHKIQPKSEHQKQNSKQRDRHTNLTRVRFGETLERESTFPWWRARERNVELPENKARY